MANPERETRASLSMADLVLIELMQADDDYSEFRPNVDLNVPREVKRLHRKDSRRWLPRLIAERARLYCERVKDWNPLEIDRWITWLKFLFGVLLVAILAAVALLHAMGTTTWLFSAEHNEASIGGLMWLIVIPPLLCIPSLIGSIMLLFRRRGPGANGGSRFINALKFFTLPGLFLAMVNVWTAIRGQNKSIGERAMQQFTREKAHIVTAVFLAASNAFILFLSVAAFLAIFQFLLFHEVRYTWKSSLLNAETKVSVVRAISRSVPLVDAPSDDAIRWAFGSNGESQAEDASPDTLRDEDGRAEWSSFVLRAMVVLTILPRVLIGMLSLLLLRRSWRELMPDPGDPEIDQVVDNIITQNVTTATHTTAPELRSGPATSSVPLPSGEAPAKQWDPSAATSGPTRQLPPADSTPPEPTGSAGSHTWKLIGYDLLPTDLEQLQQVASVQRLGVEPVAGAAQRSETLQAIKGDSSIADVLFFSRATTVPDAAFSKFLSRVSEVVNERNGKVLLIIVGLNDHLERVSGDVARHRERIRRWTQAAQTILSQSDVHEVEIQSRDERKRIDDLLRAPASNDSSPTLASAGSTHFADKFHAGLKVVRAHVAAAVKGVAKDNDSKGALQADDWATVSEETRAALLKLYDDEYQVFRGSELVDKCRQRLSGLELPAGLPEGISEGLAESGRNVLAQSVAAYQYLGSLLSPRWLIPGAIAGVGIGAAAPFLAGGAPLLLAALPSVVPGGAMSGMLGGVMAKHWWRGGVGKTDEPLDSTEGLPVGDTFHGLDLDATVRSLLLLLLILEFQGNPHDVIGQKIQQHLAPAVPASIVTLKEVNDAVDRLETSLSADLEAQR